MKSRFVRLCACKILALCAICGPLVLTAQVQERPGSGKGIDIDKELRADVPPDRAKSYYHFALSKWYEYSGELTRAVGEMRNALKYDQRSPSVHLELANILARTGAPREAIEEAEEAARLDPKDPGPHWVLAEIYIGSQTRDPAIAKESLRKAVKELEITRDLAPKDERPYFALGRAYFQLEDVEKGVQAYEKYQSMVPGVDAGYVEIARHYERAGNHEKAIEYLNKALQSRPDSPESTLILANLYAKLNRDKDAVPLYKKALQLIGNNLSIKRQLASSLLDIGEYGEAARILEELNKISPQDADIKMLLGRGLLGSRQAARAIELFKSVLESSKDHLEAEFYLGTAYEQSGNLAEAEKIFSRLLDETKDGSEEHKANRLVFQQHLAAIYQDMGELDKAITLYEQLVQDEIEPNPRLSFYLANAYRLNRQIDKALGLGREQYRKNPDDVSIALVYARTLADSGKIKEGAGVLQKLLKTEPSNIDIYLNLSQIYVQGKRYADAEKVLRIAREKRLDSERLKFQLATVYERRKDFDRAESLFRELLKENPKNAMALNYIGYMLADRGVRLEEAVKYVEQALAIDPDNGAYLDSLGWAFFKLNDLEKAEEYLLRAVGIAKHDPVIHDHLGDLYFKTGHYEKAVEYWQKSVAKGTEPEETRKVREKLEKLQETLRKPKRH